MSIYEEYADLFSRYVAKIGFTPVALKDVTNLLQKFVKGNVALDYGCGTGRSATFLKELGFIVEGVDINDHMLIRARQALPENNFQLLQEGKIPANNEHYDLVFCSLVLMEINSKRDLIATLLEIARVLKPDGTFLAVITNEGSYCSDGAYATSKYEENKNLKSGDRVKLWMKGTNFFFPDYFWTEKDYREVLEKAGLEVILVHHVLGADGDPCAGVNEEKALHDIYVAKKKRTDFT